jgi:hypothetical protein
MNSFFRELKQRKVYRVALGYAVVAWLVIQISGVAVSRVEESCHLTRPLERSEPLSRWVDLPWAVSFSSRDVPVLALWNHRVQSEPRQYSPPDV